MLTTHAKSDVEPDTSWLNLNSEFGDAIDFT